MHPVSDPRPLTSAPGLYIHVPFCRSKCLYCDFYSVTDLPLAPVWLQALDREMQIYKDKFPSVDTLYLGGGTPSLLDGAQITALFQLLRRHFLFFPDTEITLEANPDDLSREKLALYRDLKVNRLSVGVQSFNDQELTFLGRRHTPRQAIQALELSRDAGFNDLSLDMMYALPGQTEARWRQNIEQALTFQPEHLSCYQLTIEAGTPLSDLQAQGGFTPAGEDAQRALFLFTSQFLEDRGYLHYEISNFAREERYYSRHNRKYWGHVPYLGLGPGAHSFQDGQRWWNHRSLARYLQALKEDRAPVAGRETLTPEQLQLERLHLGFRTAAGVPLKVLQCYPRRQAILRELQDSGLVTIGDHRVRPTRRGFLLADRLPLWFE